MHKRLLLLVSLALWFGALGRALAADGFQRMEFTVDGALRTALVYAPGSAKTNPAPLVFVFHGHGGNARQAARSFAMDRHWPEAISVYMQGMDTPGQLNDPQGRLPGWQAAAGDQEDRDLKFFDAVLARLKQEYQVDPKRVYATGHSNGGGFTYLLWLTRADVFAAVAPSSAVARYVYQLKPKPVLHVAGQNDALVRFSWQKRMMEALVEVNGCAAPGESWDKDCTIYRSKNGTPVVTFVYAGGHQFNFAAPDLIVKFFKQN